MSSEHITESAFKAFFNKFLEDTNLIVGFVVDTLRADVTKAEDRARTAERALEERDEKIAALEGDLEMALYDANQAAIGMRIGDVQQNIRIRDLERSKAAITQELASRTVASAIAVEKLQEAGDKVLEVSAQIEAENRELKARITDLGTIFFNLRSLVPGQQGDIVTAIHEELGSLKREIKRLSADLLSYQAMVRFDARHISLEEMQRALERDSLDVNGPIDVG